MRRSSSTSHIPLPRHEPKSRARSSVKPSAKETGVSAKKTRQGSIDRLAVPTLKRSISLSNFRTPTIGSSSSKTSISKKSTGTTPTWGAAGYQRPTSTNLVTPSSARSRSRSRSPFKLGSEKTSNKKFISEQYAKVRRFLQEHPNCQEHIPDIIKPPTLNTFAYVMNLLLKEIDPSIMINTTNYKDIVLNTLKTLHYPGNITNSLMKTVNTMHAWPQVISIFGWLVDLISIIRRADLPPSPELEDYVKYQKVECLIDYIVKRYLLYNSDNEQIEAVDAAFSENFAKILNVDEEETKKLEKEVNDLSQLKEKQMKQIKEQKEKNDQMRSEIDRLQNEVSAFYEGREARQDDLDCEIAALKARKEKLKQAIDEKRKSIATLTEAIKTQPCTVEEKKRIVKHIEEMKHTIDLKKEKIKHQKYIKEECELKLAEAKKKVETEVYRINNILMKLAVVEPELKILQLKETDFLSQEFRKDIQTLVKDIQVFEAKLTKEVAHLQSQIPNVKKETTSLERQVEFLQEQIRTLQENKKTLVTKIENCSQEIEDINMRREERRKEYLQKIKELEENAPNVEAVKLKLKEVTDLKIKREAEFDLHKEESLAFFAKLHNLIFGNLVEMNQVRTEVFDIIHEFLKKINASQNDIIKDLHNLDDLK